MMKLYESLPDSVTVGGKRYRCDFDFRNVLKMLDVMQRTDIVPDARDYLCAKCVIRSKLRLRSAPDAFRALSDILFDKTPETGEKGGKITSYEQDADLIRTAFRQVYQINLFKDRLSWFEFRELLHNLPDGNRYEDVLGIRARPMPAPTKWNAKEREWLLKAKQSVALHLTEAEAARKYDADVGRLFAGMMSIAKKEVKENGK